LKVQPIAPYLQPIRKSVTVARPAAEAFEIFTAGISRWWPLGTYSIGQSRAVRCAVEPFVGGELYEVRDDGERCPWGRVVAWDPPARVVFTWHPGRDPQTAQEIEVRFVPEGGKTVVKLEHRGWERLGEQAEQSRKGYDEGWDTVLGLYAGKRARE
jgi:uncharacterized protein YndB with AHSA1/START domain